jgi:6-pyruvoyltetrahydropterin/6-carboxytetrahydropterin synthase
MVYDFGLMKQNMKDIIDSFDHSIAIWNKDSSEYIEDMKKHSKRFVILPVSPSAEQFSRVIFILIDKLLKQTSMQNGEKEVKLNSVIVHETKTGYAQCFRDDAYSELMGKIDIDEIIFSKDIKDDWKDSKMFEKLKSNQTFTNPLSV